MDWYELSYPAFLNQPTKTREDVIRLVAYAYSWMPTIPEVNTDVNWDRLLIQINELKSGNIANRKELLASLIPLTNNSIVGASKVLHFVAPALVPIIDSRVIRSWNNRFAEQKLGYNFKLPKSFYFNDEAGKYKVIETYLKYWDTMQALSSETGKTMRQLEFELYTEGLAFK